MTVYTADSLFVVVTGVGQCVYDALEGTLGGQPDRFCPLVPGEIAWDECECGQLTQTITQTFPSNEFPTPATNEKIVNNCAPRVIGATIVMSLTRCVPIPNEKNIAPKCDALLRAARVLESDRFIMREAVMCCLADMRNDFANPRIIDYSVGLADSVGPQGACAGVVLTYQVSMSGICCG